MVLEDAVRSKRNHSTVNNKKNLSTIMVLVGVVRSERNHSTVNNKKI